MVSVGIFHKFGAIMRLHGLYCLILLAALGGCAHGEKSSNWQDAYDAADLLFAAGEFGQAITGFQQAREIATDSEEQRASSHGEAVSMVWGEDFPGARDLLAVLAARYREAGDEVGLNDTLALYAFVLRHLGEEDAADILDEQRAGITGDLDPFIWRFDEDSNLNRHLATGMTFPEEIATFYLASMSQNNEYGSDVSVEYQLDTAFGTERISVGLVSKPDISYPDFVSESVSDLHMYPGEPTYGQNFLFNRIRNDRAISIRRYDITLESFMGDQRPHRSDLWIIPVDNWAIRIFHTYPVAREEAAAKAFEAFYENLKWPSKFPDFAAASDSSAKAPVIDPELAAMIDNDSGEIDERQEKLRAFIARDDVSDDNLGRAFRAMAANYWASDEQARSLEAAIKSAKLLHNKFSGGWYLVLVAQSADRPKIAAEALTSLMQDFPGRFSDIEIRWFWKVIRGLRDAGADKQHMALLRTAYDVGYQKGEPDGGADYIYVSLVKILLESGEVAEAAAIAGEIRTARPWLSIAVDREYEALWHSEYLDIDSILADLVERDVGAAMDGAMTHPESVMAMRSLIKALHYSGQLAAAENLTVRVGNNAKLYHGKQSDWHWFMNSAAYLFEDMEQFERANRVMQSLADIKPEDNGDIVSQIINFGAMLVRQGDAKRALEILSIVDGTKYVSDYGQGWIDASAVCAYDLLADQAAADTAAVHLTENPDQNYAAAMETLLCLNRLDEAAELAILRLRDESARSGMLEAFANYKESVSQPAYVKELFDRLKMVRDRPEVLAEIGKYGRIIDFPLERAYWGEF